MEFKKCERCGSFFTSNNNVCYNCSTKEKVEFSKFKSYIEENNIGDINSLNDISTITGLNTKTINRFLENTDFWNIDN